ncbi:MAG: hypothetical protein H5T60_08750 [Anaerolineae bacterium]|nr:hypothetical protein [Anaerolineae bacterium]
MGSWLVGQFLSAAAALACEIILTRLFSLSQWYHFAFLAISVALLGYGASGTFLAVTRRRIPLSLLAAGQALGTAAGYLAANFIPFDSFRIAWEPVQVLYMALYYLSLTVPFFFAGLISAVLLERRELPAGRVYAANLMGSGAGCLLSLALQPYLAGVGSLLACAALAGAGGATFAVGEGRRWRIGAALALTVLLGALALGPPAGWEIRPSPYKSLMQVLRHPGARILFQRWNAFSRVDVVQAEGIRSMPGMSLGYMHAPPAQMGLFVDGDNLSPIQMSSSAADLAFLDYLPEAVLFQLRPGADIVIVEPLAGLAVWGALHGGARHITALMANPLVWQAVEETAPADANPFRAPNVTVIFGGARSFLQHPGHTYDIVQFPLTDSYHPIRSGAFSLSENYLLTVEAMRAGLRALQPDGILAITRWLQLPPTESVRAGALVVEALAAEGVAEPARHIIALRSWSTCLILAKRRPFTPQEIGLVRAFATARQFDLVTYPGMSEEESNRFNLLPEPVYYRAWQAMLTARDRRQFYHSTPFDLTPTTDNRPFFFHFFTWKQAPEVWQTLGMTWQPFGGSGYFVLIALLLLTLLAGMVLVLLPLWLRGGPAAPRRLRAGTLLAFTCLGLGFMMVELPLLQQCILLLDQPTYAFATVLFTLLVFSGVGSMMSARMPPALALGGTVLAALALAAGLSPLVHAALGAPLWARMGLTELALAPAGWVMGMPLARLVSRLRERAPALIPWAWAANGVASVTSSVLATMMALSWGFQAVLVIGAGAYAGAALAGWRLVLQDDQQAHRQDNDAEG